MLWTVRRTGRPATEVRVRAPSEDRAVRTFAGTLYPGAMDEDIGVLRDRDRERDGNGEWHGWDVGLNREGDFVATRSIEVRRNG